MDQYLDAVLLSKFLFPAPTSSYHDKSFSGELLWVPLVADDAASKGYVFPCLLLACGTARYIVLYFHRNAEDLGTCKRFCEALRDQLYVHVLAVEYPGYGPNTGAPPASAAQATKHAFAAFRFVRDALQWPRDSILVFGCSVGTGVAVALAAQEEVAGVVLAAPFLSIREACKDRIGTFARFITEQFPNNVSAPHIRSPTLIVHGQKDRVIPYNHGEQLYDLCTCKKALISPFELDHNTCLLKDEWFLLRPMLKFFSLPDYNFEYMRVPSWAFRRPPNGESQRRVETGSTAVTVPLVAPAFDSAHSEGQEPEEGLCEIPENESSFTPVPKTSQVSMGFFAAISNVLEPEKLANSSTNAARCGG